MKEYEKKRNGGSERKGRGGEGRGGEEEVRGKRGEEREGGRGGEGERATVVHTVTVFAICHFYYTARCVVGHPMNLDSF